MTSFESRSRFGRVVVAVLKFMQRPDSAASAAILAVASVLVASGLTRASVMEVNRAFREARAATESVIPFQTPLPVLAAIGNSAGSAVQIFVVADSTQHQRRLFCEVSRELPADAGITLLALSSVDSGCGSVVQLVSDPRNREAVYKELRGARLVAVSARGTALYSRRELRGVAEIRELAEYFLSPERPLGEPLGPVAPDNLSSLVEKR